MPVAPDEFDFIPQAESDLADIQQRNSDDATRILKKIQQWEEWLQFGRVPQEHLTHLTDSPAEFNFYRQWVGNSGYRVIYEISDGTMTVVAILPKDDHTYDIDALVERLRRYLGV